MSIRTLEESSIRILEGIHKGLVLKDFLEDYHFVKGKKNKYNLLRDKPEWIDKKTNAYLAAMAEHLCLKMRMRPPEWVYIEKYFLKRPYFVGGLESLKAILIVQSPVAFRRRNIFVTSDVCSHV